MASIPIKVRTHDMLRLKQECDEYLTSIIDIEEIKHIKRIMRLSQLCGQAIIILQEIDEDIHTDTLTMPGMKK